MILKAQLSSQAAETAETPGGLFLASKELAFYSAVYRKSFN
jgi:hypothetical protein